MLDEPKPQLQDVCRDAKGRFVPGQSGNPGGKRPGTVSLVAKLRQYLVEHPEEVKAIIEAMAKQGKLGNMMATKEMLDRIDGKVAETHRLEGELPIKLVFVPAQELLDKPDEPKLLEQG